MRVYGLNKNFVFLSLVSNSERLLFITNKSNIPSQYHGSICDKTSINQNLLFFFTFFNTTTAICLVNIDIVFRFCKKNILLTRIWMIYQHTVTCFFFFLLRARPPKRDYIYLFFYCVYTKKNDSYKRVPASCCLFFSILLNTRCIRKNSDLKLVDYLFWPRNRDIYTYVLTDFSRRIITMQLGLSAKCELALLRRVYWETDDSSNNSIGGLQTLLCRNNFCKRVR